MTFLRFLLETPDCNSRFVFLMQGLAVAVSIPILCVAYVMTHDPMAREGYSTTIGVLLSGGSLATLARGYNKRSVGDANTTPPDPKG